MDEACAPQDITHLVFVAMDISPTLTESRQLIQRYGSGAFTIAGKEYKGSVLVLPERTCAWDVAGFDAISEASLAPVLQTPPPEILVVGSGATQGFFSPELRARLRGLGVAVECMDTGAACRTFNILMSEDRKVAAALLAV